MLNTIEIFFQAKSTSCKLNLAKNMSIWQHCDVIFVCWENTPCVSNTEGNAANRKYLRNIRRSWNLRKPKTKLTREKIKIFNPCSLIIILLSLDYHELMGVNLVLKKLKFARRKSTSWLWKWKITENQYDFSSICTHFSKFKPAEFNNWVNGYYLIDNMVPKLDVRIFNEWYQFSFLSTSTSWWLIGWNANDVFF